MLSNRLIKVYLGRKESSFRHLNDGLPQGSVLAPLLFNIYTADIPLTESRKFIYADDIALATQHRDLRATESILTRDLATLGEYFKIWKLRPNPTKTEVACFHLNNKLANHKLNVSFNGVPLNHNERPQYLGVTLDRSLTFKSHLKKTAAKVSTRANLVQHLAGTSWGANANVLRISALSLVFSTAEYCAPVWLNSAHVGNVDTQLNRVMRTISGTLMATPLPWLPVLCNIAPPEIRRRDALLKEYTKIISAPNLPILQDLPPVINRLRSRRPPLQLARLLQNRNFSAITSWTESWGEFEGRNHTLVPDPTIKLGGMDLPRKEWAALNRFRTDVGRCNYWKARWGQVLEQSCDCGADYQTMSHIVNNCPLRAFSGALAGLNEVSAASVNWLKELDLEV